MGAQGDPLAYRQDGEWLFITLNQTPSTLLDILLLCSSYNPETFHSPPDQTEATGPTQQPMGRILF